MGDRFIALGIDLWNGSPRTVEASWVDAGLATYPILVGGGDVGRAYGLPQDHYLVIDHEGIVRFRSQGGIDTRFNRDEIRAAIDESLAELAIALDVPSQEDEELPEGTTAVVEESAQPAGFELEHAYPNPFNMRTTIGLTLRDPAMLTLIIYDLRGKVVGNLSGAYGRGRHQLTWNGQDGDGDAVASGVYVLVAKTPWQRQVRKLMLLK